MRSRRSSPTSRRRTARAAASTRRSRPLTARPRSRDPFPLRSPPTQSVCTRAAEARSCSRDLHGGDSSRRRRSTALRSQARAIDAIPNMRRGERRGCGSENGTSDGDLYRDARHRARGRAADPRARARRSREPRHHRRRAAVRHRRVVVARERAGLDGRGGRDAVANAARGIAGRERGARGRRAAGRRAVTAPGRAGHDRARRARSTRGHGPERAARRGGRRRAGER